MCTRFHIERQIPEIREIMEQSAKTTLAARFRDKYTRPVLSYGEIRPTDVVPVIAPDSKGNRAVFPMKWGFTLPNSNKPLVNARVESAATKPTFAESWSRRRCIIPAAYYYEWKHNKTIDGKTKTGDKYLIRPKDTLITWLCGLYRFEDDLPVFTVLTREPAEELAQIHDRMPLILPADHIDEWINPFSPPDLLLSYALTDMVMEKADA